MRTGAVGGAQRSLIRFVAVWARLIPAVSSYIDVRPVLRARPTVICQRHGSRRSARVAANSGQAELVAARAASRSHTPRARKKSNLICAARPPSSGCIVVHAALCVLQRRALRSPRAKPRRGQASTGAQLRGRFVRSRQGRATREPRIAPPCDRHAIVPAAPPPMLTDRHSCASRIRTGCRDGALRGGRKVESTEEACSRLLTATVVR